MRILSPYIQMVPKPAGTAAHIPPERDERQGLNHAARPDRPIAFSGRTLCIFCGRGNRLGIGERSCLLCKLHLRLRQETQMELFHSAALFFQIPPLPGCRSTCPPLCKTGAVAGAIPRVLLRVPFQRAPRWGQRLAEGVRRLTTASKPLTTNWGRRIVLEGENTSA